MSTSLIAQIRGENPDLNVVEVNGCISVSIDDNFTFPIQDSDGSINLELLRSGKRMVRFYQKREELQKKGYGGYYVAVTDTVMKVFMTEDEAIGFSETVPDGCFVSAITESKLDF